MHRHIRDFHWAAGAKFENSSGKQPQDNRKKKKMAEMVNNGLRFAQLLIMWHWHININKGASYDRMTKMNFVVFRGLSHVYTFPPPSPPPPLTLRPNIRKGILTTVCFVTPVWAVWLVVALQSLAQTFSSRRTIYLLFITIPVSCKCKQMTLKESSNFLFNHIYK